MLRASSKPSKRNCWALQSIMQMSFRPLRKLRCGRPDQIDTCCGSGGNQKRSIRAYLPYRSRAGSVTGATSGMWPSNLVWFAIANLRMPITCVLRKAGHSAARSVDEFTVPLCRGHHREVHRCGDETAWWRKSGINPTGAARVLWLETHPISNSPNKIDREDASSIAVRDTTTASRPRP